MNGINIGQDMAVMFFRMDCKEKTKDWDKQKKLDFAKKLSEITLNDGRFYLGSHKEIWQFPEISERKFTPLKIYAWLEELMYSAKKLDVNPTITKMVHAFEGQK